MDALSLLTTSIPGYFTIGPLFILFIVLIVLFVKRDKSSGEQQQAAAQTSSGAPMQQVQAAAPISFSTPAPSVEQQIPSVPPVQSVAVASVEPAGVIPPISSWKPMPAPQAPTASPVADESQLQVQAVVAEVPVTAVAQSPVVVSTGEHDSISQTSPLPASEVMPLTQQAPSQTSAEGLKV